MYQKRKQLKIKNIQKFKNTKYSHIGKKTKLYILFGKNFIGNKSFLIKKKEVLKKALLLLKYFKVGLPIW